MGARGDVATKEFIEVHLLIFRIGIRRVQNFTLTLHKQTPAEKNTN
jgi:hypothetical protein